MALPTDLGRNSMSLPILSFGSLTLEFTAVDDYVFKQQLRLTTFEPASSCSFQTMAVFRSRRMLNGFHPEPLFALVVGRWGRYPVL